jgi:hypothetical protein
MKTGPDVHDTAQNGFGGAKHENGTRRPWNRPKQVRERQTGKRDTTPTVPLKMSPGVQNMKTGLGALGTAQYESESVKHENST